MEGVLSFHSLQVVVVLSLESHIVLIFMAHLSVLACIEVGIVEYVADRTVVVDCIVVLVDVLQVVY